MNTLAPEPVPATAPSPAVPRRRVQRSGGAMLGEKCIEWIIRLCGISAIVFVFAIFFFVFREGAPILFGGGTGGHGAVEAGGSKSSFDLSKFLFTQTWYPTSLNTPRYGVGALIIGTF